MNIENGIRNSATAVSNEDVDSRSAVSRTPPPPNHPPHISHSTLSLFVCLMDYEDPARARALRSSVLLLGHRFPSVRKTTAEALYLKLLANETIVDEVW